MSEVQFVRQDDHEVRFAHRLGSEVVWTAGLVAFCYFGYRSALVSPFSRWFYGVFGLVAAAIGLANMLWRYQLTLDVRSRTWTRRTGFWPRALTRAGTFDDLDGLILAIEIRSTGRNVKYPVWVIRLSIKRESHSDSIAEFTNERKAYQRFESLVKTLRLDAIDRTGDRERRLPWHAVERPLVSQVARVGSRSARIAAVPTLPPGSAIHVSDVQPNTSIVLPARGFSRHAVVPILIASFFVVFGAISWRNSTLLEGSPPDITYILVPAAFALIGAGLILLIVEASISRDEIQNRGERIVFGRRLFGLRLRKSLEKRFIEEIAVKPAPTFDVGFLPERSQSAAIHHHVFVRSQHELLHVGGNLTPDEQEWLRGTLMSWLTG